MVDHTYKKTILSNNFPEIHYMVEAEGAAINYALQQITMNHDVSMDVTDILMVKNPLICNNILEDLTMDNHPSQLYLFKPISYFIQKKLHFITSFFTIKNNSYVSYYELGPIIFAQHMPRTIPTLIMHSVEYNEDSIALYMALKKQGNHNTYLISTKNKNNEEINTIKKVIFKINNISVDKQDEFNDEFKIDDHNDIDIKQYQPPLDETYITRFRREKVIDETKVYLQNSIKIITKIGCGIICFWFSYKLYNFCAIL